MTALATLTLTTAYVKADDQTDANNQANQESVDYSGEVRISGKKNLERLAQFNYLLQYNLGRDIYPQAVGFSGEKQKINVRYEGDKNNFKVYYSKSKNMENFNADKLKGVKTYATLTKKTYASKDEAQAEVGYHNLETNKIGNKVTMLTQNQVAVVTKAAGAQTLSWNLGDKWEMQVVGVGQKAKAKAVKYAKKVAKTGLPSIKGQGVMVLSDEGQVKWYDGKVVYTLKTNTYKVGLSMLQALTNPEAQAKAESSASAASSSSQAE